MQTEHTKAEKGQIEDAGKEDSISLLYVRLPTKLMFMVRWQAYLENKNLAGMVETLLWEGLRGRPWSDDQA